MLLVSEHSLRCDLFLNLRGMTCTMTGIVFSTTTKKAICWDMVIQRYLIANLKNVEFIIKFLTFESKPWLLCCQIWARFEKLWSLLKLWRNNMQDDWSRFLKRKTRRRRICWDMFIQRWLISNCRIRHIWKIRDIFEISSETSDMTRFNFFFRKNVYKEGLIKDLLRTVELFHLWYLVKSEYSLRHFWDLFWNTRGAVTIFLSRRNKWVIK